MLRLSRPWLRLSYFFLAFALLWFACALNIPSASAASIEVYGGGGGGGGGGGVTTGMGGAPNQGLGGAGGAGGSAAQNGFAGGNGSGFDNGNDAGGGGGGGGTTGAGQSVSASLGGNAGAGGNATDGQNSVGGIGGAGGNGGAGGAASLTLTGATVTSTGAVLVQSGAAGAAGSGNGPANGAGGVGGAASLTVQNTLIAPSVTAWKRDGALAVSIATLNVTGNDTALTATGTAATDFQITSTSLSSGHLLSINNSAGAMTLSTLTVTGQGRLFVADSTKATIGTLNAAGADLTFVLPAGVVANQTIVAVTNANITGATIGVDDGNGRITMNPGQSVKLLAASGTLTGTAANLTVLTPNGDIFDLQVSGKDLLLILQQISPANPDYERLKAYAEGRTATLAFVNQGADLILNQGMGSALMSTRGPGFQFNAFAAGQGGWSRYNTGSHVDVSGASMLAGIAVGNDAGPGRLTAGLFFEGGWGSYNSYNSFSNFASVKGDGDTNYYGGGILGRYDLKSGALSGLYFDASARMGRASTDFSTGDIRYNGNKADFDSDSMYWGAHAGLGYQWSFTEKAMLDVSGKFIWTRQDGDNVNVSGDKVRFDSAESLRTRLGGRFNYAVCDYATPYVGAYWEHEFDGKQRSSVNGVGVGSPSLKGDTGVGELGLTIRPVKDSGFSMDLGVQGYTGVREGVTGSLQLKFEF